MKRAFVFVLGVVLASFCAASVLAPVAVAEEEIVTTGEEQAETVAVNLEVDKSLVFGQLSERGVSYTSSFKIRNPGAEDVKIELSFENTQYTDLEDRWKIGADWLAIVGGQVRQIIPANGEKDIRVRVTVPADVESGSQYATIKVAAGETEYKVDVRMDIAGDDLKYAGELKGTSISAFSFSDDITTQATVKNTGNGGFTAKQVVRYRKGLSEAGDWITLAEEEREVPNGTEVKFDTEKAEKVGFGIFKVEQKITYVNEKGEMVEAGNSRTVINVPIWLLIVIGVVVLLIIGLTVFLAIRSKKKEEEEQEAEEAEKAKKSKKNTKVDLEIDEDKE